MANTGFKGIDVLQTGGPVLSAACFYDASNNLLITGSPVYEWYEIQVTSGTVTIKTFDFADNTFKATACTTPQQALTQVMGNNGTVSTGIWCHAITTSTAFNRGGMYFRRYYHASAAQTYQVRMAGYGMGEGDEVITAAGKSPATIAEGDLTDSRLTSIGTNALTAATKASSAYDTINNPSYGNNGLFDQLTDTSSGLAAIKNGLGDLLNGDGGIGDIAARLDDPTYGLAAIASLAAGAGAAAAQAYATIQDANVYLSGILNNDTTGLAALKSLLDAVGTAVTAVNIRAALGLAQANLDTQLTDIRGVGGGAYAVSVTVQSGSTPLQSATVAYEIGGVTVAYGSTNSSGVFSAALDAGTYHRTVRKVGFVSDVSTVVISGATTATVSLTSGIPTITPTSSQSIGSMVTYDAFGAVKGNVEVSFQMVSPPTVLGEEFDGGVVTATSSSAGVLQQAFCRGARYRVWVVGGGSEFFTVPDTTSFTLPTVLAG